MNAIPAQRIQDALAPSTRPSKFWDELDRTESDDESRMSYGAAMGIVNGLRP